VVSDVGLVNEVNQRWSRLVLGWVTFSGWVNHLGCNQPAASTQPSVLWGRQNEDQLRLQRQRCGSYVHGVTRDENSRHDMLTLMCRRVSVFW